MTFYLIAVAIILLDQATKQVIVRALRLGQGIPIIPGFFDIVFVLNPGAAFSFLATLPDSVRDGGGLPAGARVPVSLAGLQRGRLRHLCRGGPDAPGHAPGLAPRKRKASTETANERQ